MRIISGSAKGRTLKVAQSGVRPTSDRVRQSIFNRLTALGIDWSATFVLDAFAGSGAFAFEALSRGAKAAYAIEKDSQAILAIRSNSESTQLELEVVQGDVVKVISTKLSGHYNLIFIDPPYEYANENISTLLQLLQTHDALMTHGTCIVERSARTPDFDLPENFVLDDVRNHGDTRIFWLVW